MLKKFLITVLGSIAGVWIAIGIGVLAMVCLFGTIAQGFSESKPAGEVRKHSALWLDLAGNMPERYQPADIWQLIRESETPGESLVDVLDAIRLAASDSKIDGIYMTSAAGGGLGGGIAAREEIVAALRDFKKSGKWIVAYGDTYTQGDYMLASLADSLYLNPSGSVDVHGVASQVPFFTGLMDKLGVKMQVVRVGTYKSAVEPFMAETMSEASREQTTVMVDSIWSYVSGVIGAQRRVAPAAVNGWADSVCFTWNATRLLDSGVVGSLTYRRLADDAVKELCGLDTDDDLRLVTPGEYMTSRKPVSAAKKHIAVLVAAGDIVDAGEGGIVAESMVPEILALADDDNVGALVMRVNSGGGSAFASEQIWEALEYFKSTGKPFYVSMGDYAASGGYYISCGADRIYADHTTLTGSIGVFGMIPDVSGLVTDKLGIRFSTVSTNPNGAVTAPVEPLNAAQLRGLQASVEDVYDQFTSRVAAGRDMPQDSVKRIAEGRVWTGGSALDLGLVDAIGGLRDAVRDIADESGIDPDKVVYYPDVKADFLAEFIRSTRGSVPMGAVTVDGATLRLLRFMDYLQHMPRVQARMMPVEIH